MNVVAASAGPWVDTAWPLTPVVCQALVAAGKRGVGRYVPLPGNNSAGDISAAEAQRITGAGLQLLLVQHVRRPGWSPLHCDGRADAVAACAAALAAGYPSGAHLFLDLEGIVGTDAPSCAVFAQDWAVEVRRYFAAGLYVGYDVPLSAAQLYALPSFTSYWSDPGPRNVATRGFALKQGAGVVISGVGFDLDEVRADELGDVPMVAAA